MWCGFLRFEFFSLDGLVGNVFCIFRLRKREQRMKLQIPERSVIQHEWYIVTYNWNIWRLIFFVHENDKLKDSEQGYVKVYHLQFFLIYEIEKSHFQNSKITFTEKLVSNLKQKNLFTNFFKFLFKIMLFNIFKRFFVWIWPHGLDSWSLVLDLCIFIMQSQIQYFYSTECNQLISMALGLHFFIWNFDTMVDSLFQIEGNGNNAWRI